MKIDVGEGGRRKDDLLTFGVSRSNDRAAAKAPGSAIEGMRGGEGGATLLNFVTDGIQKRPLTVTLSVQSRTVAEGLDISSIGHKEGSAKFQLDPRNAKVAPPEENTAAVSAANGADSCFRCSASPRSPTPCVCSATRGKDEARGGCTGGDPAVNASTFGGGERSEEVVQPEKVTRIEGTNGSCEGHPSMLAPDAMRVGLDGGDVLNDTSSGTGTRSTGNDSDDKLEVDVGGDVSVESRHASLPSCSNADDHAIVSRELAEASVSSKNDDTKSGAEIGTAQEDERLLGDTIDRLSLSLAQVQQLSASVEARQSELSARPKRRPHPSSKQSAAFARKVRAKSTGSVKTPKAHDVDVKMEEEAILKPRLLIKIPRSAVTAASAHAAEAAASGTVVTGTPSAELIKEESVQNDISDMRSAKRGKGKSGVKRARPLAGTRAIPPPPPPAPTSRQELPPGCGPPCPGLEAIFGREVETPDLDTAHDGDAHMNASQASQRLTASSSATPKELACHVQALRLDYLVQKARPILTKLMAAGTGPQRGVFNVPVDPEKQGIPDYFKRVPHPMDLGTIKARLLSMHYTTPEAFASDVRLVFKNAIGFNPETHFVHTWAVQLLADFDQEYSKQVGKLDEGWAKSLSHSCQLCQGQTCTLCGDKCLKLEPPVIICQHCNKRVVRGGVYHITRDGCRLWCSRCHPSLPTELPSDGDPESIAPALPPETETPGESVGEGYRVGNDKVGCRESRSLSTGADSTDGGGQPPDGIAGGETSASAASGGTNAEVSAPQRDSSSQASSSNFIASEVVRLGGEPPMAPTAQTTGSSPEVQGAGSEVPSTTPTAIPAVPSPAVGGAEGTSTTESQENVAMCGDEMMGQCTSSTGEEISSAAVARATASSSRSVNSAGSTVSRGPLKRDLLRRKFDEEISEPWVQCDRCNSWVHQVCALFNARANVGEARFVCPLCRLRDVVFPTKPEDETSPRKKPKAEHTLANGEQHSETSCRSTVGNVSLKPETTHPTMTEAEGSAAAGDVEKQIMQGCDDATGNEAAHVSIAKKGTSVADDRPAMAVLDKRQESSEDQQETEASGGEAHVAQMRGNVSPTAPVVGGYAGGAEATRGVETGGCAASNEKMNVDEGVVTPASQSAQDGAGISDAEGRAASKDKVDVYAASSLPHTPLSRYVELRVRQRLSKLENADVADTLSIRLVSNVEATCEVHAVLRETFCCKEGLGVGPNKTEVPEALKYRSKALSMFQRMDGVEVCLFSMYVQEYGADAPYFNARRAYISYLDSVEYFRPRRHRTAVYHEILVAYLDWIRRRGFKAAHIWSCPPQRGNNFIFWCHPLHQKTPTRDRLSSWYGNMLKRATQLGVAAKVTTLDKTHFQEVEKIGILLKNRRTSAAASAAATLAGVKGPDDLPMRPEIPVIFEGDFWAEEAVRLARQVDRKDEGTEDGQTPLEICRSALEELIRHQQGAPFTAPVDPTRDRCPDYLQVIEHPMDLGTVAERLDRMQYHDAAAFVCDVRLIFDNARKYNPPKHPIHVAASKLNKVFDKAVRALESAVNRLPGMHDLGLEHLLLEEPPLPSTPVSGSKSSPTVSEPKLASREKAAAPTCNDAGASGPLSHLARQIWATHTARTARSVEALPSMREDSPLEVGLLPALHHQTSEACSVGTAGGSDGAPSDRLSRSMSTSLMSASEFYGPSGARTLQRRGSTASAMSLAESYGEAEAGTSGDGREKRHEGEQALSMFIADDSGNDQDKSSADVLSSSRYVGNHCDVVSVTVEEQPKQPSDKIPPSVQRGDEGDGEGGGDASKGCAINKATNPAEANGVSAEDVTVTGDCSVQDGEIVTTVSTVASVTAGPSALDTKPCESEGLHRAAYPAAPVLPGTVPPPLSLETPALASGSIGSASLASEGFSLSSSLGSGLGDEGIPRPTGHLRSLSVDSSGPSPCRRSVSAGAFPSSPLPGAETPLSGLSRGFSADSHGFGTSGSRMSGGSHSPRLRAKSTDGSGRKSNKKSKRGKSPGVAVMGKADRIGRMLQSLSRAVMRISKDLLVVSLGEPDRPAVPSLGRGASASNAEALAAEREAWHSSSGLDGVLTSDCHDPDPSISRALVDARHTFLEMCQFRHYQFDTLRRAKHSSAMVLYHLHRPESRSLNPFCSRCHRPVRFVRYHCGVCNYDLCSPCDEEVYTKCEDGHDLTPYRVTFSTEDVNKSPEAGCTLATGGPALSPHRGNRRSRSDSESNLGNQVQESTLPADDAKDASDSPQRDGTNDAEHDASASSLSRSDADRSREHVAEGATKADCAKVEDENSIAEYSSHEATDPKAALNVGAGSGS